MAEREDARATNIWRFPRVTSAVVPLVARAFVYFRSGQRPAVAATRPSLARRSTLKPSKKEEEAPSCFMTRTPSTGQSRSTPVFAPLQFPVCSFFFLLRASGLQSATPSLPLPAGRQHNSKSCFVLLCLRHGVPVRLTIPKPPTTTIPWFLPPAEPRLPARHVGPQQSLCEECLALALAGTQPWARQAQIDSLRTGALSPRALSHGRPEPAIPLPKPLPCLARLRPIWAGAASAATI